MSDDLQRNGFRRLDLFGWRQFGVVRLEFHPRLTVLTGANASGKTTILALLARHFNWSRQYMGVPMPGKGGFIWRWLRPRSSNNDWHDVGELFYQSGSVTKVQVPRDRAGANAYEMNIPGQQQVPGLYLASHRSANSYAAVQTIPTRFLGAETLLDQFTGELRSRYQGGYTGKSAFQWFKESLISVALFGEGNSSVEGNPGARNVWVGYQGILSSLFPKSVGFRRLVVRDAEIVVETNTDPFLIDESSGGMSAIMEMAWQIFLRSRDKQQFTVMIDEPENHLHPSLQRSILPNLLTAFPSVQFIVSTHSPFIVTSVPDSAVYVLDYADDGRISSRLLDYANKAAKADETLRRVLGLESTLPVWAEERYRQLLQQFAEGVLSHESVRELRGEMVRYGLASEFPEAMLEVIDRQIGGR
jgi:predicted ATPase